MNRYAVLLFSFLPLFSGINNLNAADSGTVKAIFVNPPAEYSCAPFWIWNEKMTDNLVISTLNDLAGQGIKQVFVHPRPGLVTPYLSTEWFRLWKLTLKEAERLGIIVWLYDENSYPSGFAGGFVPELMPESKGFGLKIEEVNNPKKLPGEIVAVFEKDGDGYKKINIDEANEHVRYLAARIIKAKADGMFANRPYVNLLTKGVTEKFLEITLDAYKKQIGEEFGKRVPGVFTDEPHILPAGVQAWANDLPQVFEKRWGYSLIDNLPSLALQTGDWKRVRHNYYTTLLELYIERWGKPYYEYCEKNNLEFTGHYWEHVWPECRQVPDNMAMSAWMHRPGIDILFNQYAEGVHAQFGNVRSVMEIASLANQLGRKRTICETYGGAGWELRFEDMKRIGDWIFVLGINTMNEHLSYASIRGARKADYPQSFSYHEPWWQGYHVAVDYFRRLSAALSHGEQINEILLIEPTSTALMYQADTSQKGYLEKIGNEFQRTVVTLAKQQVEFDLGCEDVISRSGSVDGAELKVGRRAYRTVVLPGLMENLNGGTMGLLEKYAAKGGKILCCGDTPTLVDGQKSERPGMLEKGSGFKKIAANELASVLLSQAKDGFAIKSEDNNSIMFHQRRRLDDGELIFVVNTDLKAGCKGVIESAGTGIERWDAETGALSPYIFQKTQKGVQANFELAPAGSLLLFFPNKAIESAKAEKIPETIIKPNGTIKIKRNAPNVLTLDYLDLTLQGKTTPKIYYNKASQQTFTKYGFNGNPWDHGVQYDEEFVNRKFAQDSGFEAAYYFTIKDKIQKPIYAVIERPDLYTVTCNGKTIKAKQGNWWLDKSFGKIDISSAAKTGENKIVLSASPFTVFHEIAAIYILGDFRVEPNESGFVITKDEPIQMGPWNKQGYPLYADGISYKHRFKVQEQNRKYLIRLGDWFGSIAKVVVNGKEAGYIWHQPWQLDISNQIKRGNTEIEVIVIGTLKNTLGLHHTGQPGKVSPPEFRGGRPTARPQVRNIKR